MGRHTVAALAIAWMSLAAPASIGAQGAAPRNLRVLTPDVDIQRVMTRFNAALGVQCTYCHVANDFASDANPKKEVARGMECGIKLANFNDVKEGDILEAYKVQEVARTL